LPDLPQLFKLLGGDSWTVYRFLIQHQPEVEGDTALSALLRGKVAKPISHQISVRRRFTQVRGGSSFDSEPPPTRVRRGMCSVTVVPSPTALHTSSRNERPYNAWSRRRSSLKACARGRSPKKQCSTFAGVIPCPSSLTLISNQFPARQASRRSRPAVGEDCSPCWTAFSSNG
jgi:hypothetical protein